MAGPALTQFIYDYDELHIGKEEFTKRKRLKNVVHTFERCSAKRANSEQCTRKKKTGCEYCGTHMKGIPHGIVECSAVQKPTVKKISIWAQDITGIIYYLDKDFNVYQAEDIICNKENPKVIASYSIEDEKYSIHMIT